MYQISVSGASKGDSAEEGKTLAQAAGRAIASTGYSIMTGATVGIPFYAAQAYKQAGGKMSLGISPASSKVEHVVKYRLPTGPFDVVLYSGLHYVGRDSLLINSCDAVISIGGRIGTLHEFTIAMETDTPIGFLEGGGGISTEITDILKAANRGKSEDIIFGTNATEILEQLTEVLNKRNHKHIDLYR